jgi:outer membrane immunogenic protein
MNRFLIAGAAAIMLTASSVHAADMLTKAPPMAMAPPAAAGWNGFYVGGQLGGEWSSNHWDPTCIQLGGPFTCGSVLNAVVFPGEPDGSATIRSSGLRYGFYGGWMFTAYDRYVLGVEADYAYHSATGTVPAIVGCATPGCTGGVFGPGPFSGDSTSVKNGNDYSFRARAGYLVTPDLQVYATGGPAAQKVSATLVCSDTGAAGCVGPAITSSSTKTLWGYTVGAGVEWKVWNNVLVRCEYRYNDYGTWKQSAFVGSGQIEEFANVHVKSNLLTFGVAYLFGPPAH